ncbi:E3 ubiquitin-protein ligase RNF5 [Trypanosoma grayi]|uniref:E3 ubiquitin-protein ligase RNF5 n=1 Tax=Trypanosoma grayi TaxID=71804 RepID=UPI0004F48A42|nr:E3 ubiquitin-protein ligase RNF5 [Trypanosoma grayi]KEG07088.1 E3 ubiquitin-protein ligase RNF5 [Trypanosoma grayi]
MSQADFSCAICYEMASEPVVTRCGHLFCWACLKRWLERPEAVLECPVCRGRVDERISGDIIPLYGKGARTHAANAAASNSSSTTSTSAQERHQQQQQQHPRPAADRAPPVRRGMGRYANHPFSLGLGGSFMFFGGDMTTTALLIVLWAAYHFIPWREWLSQARAPWGMTSGQPQREGGRSATEQHQHQQQQQQQQELPSPQIMVRNVLICVVIAYALYYVLSAK